ncbi:DNA helicase [Microbacterium phage Sparcetus]|nr:DNA helicase [Microbacterium phage Sparcetus]
MTINIKRKGNRVLLTYPQSSWRASIAEECKSIVGWRWSDSQKAWTYPLSMDTLRQMRVVFGKELKPDDALIAWARDERRKERRAKSYATHHDASLAILPTVAPTLAEAMADRTYQRSAAKFSKTVKNYLLADEPGLGKTATALAGIIESGVWKGSHLITCPKTAIFSTWVRQIEQWTDATVYGMPDGAVNRAKTWAAFQHDDSDTKFLVVNPAMLRRLYGHYCRKCDVWAEDVKAEKVQWGEKHFIERGHPVKGSRKLRKEDWPEIFDHEWTSITVDESHEMFAAYTPSNTTQATQGLLDLRGDAKLTALTGTPLRGQEKNIWGVLDWLGANTGGHWGFIDRYMEQSKGMFGVTVHGLDPAEANDFHKLIDRYVLRRTRAEVRPDLPLGQRVDVSIPLEGKHREQYQEFEEEGEASIMNGTLSGQGLLSELTRLKQLSYGLWEWRYDTNSDAKNILTPSANSPVLEWLLQFLATRGITGKKTTSWMPEPGVAYKYVVASQFTEILDAIERDLNAKRIPTLKVTGAITGRRRTDAVAKFQSKDEEFRVMLIQTQTGGVSIDLDAWCDEMVILDETWIADDQVQLEGRINNRSGRVSPRMWHYVRVQETIQQKVAESNYAQHNLQHKLLDGRRGIDVALHLVRGDR